MIPFIGKMSSSRVNFTTPSGKVPLALLGAFAQYCSGNLSQEKKEGLNVRHKDSDRRDCIIRCSVQRVNYHRKRPTEG